MASGLRALLSPSRPGSEPGGTRCHLCALWGSLFGVPPRPLARESRECGNCRGRPSVRGTVRKAIASANPLLSTALIQVEEPIEIDG